MMTTNEICMRLTLLGLLALAPVTTQGLAHRETAEMVHCAVRGGGGWIGPSLYPQGRVRFSYISERAFDISDEKNPRDIYVAFWNSTRHAGELLVFLYYKNGQGKDTFVLNNNGHIVQKQGRLVVDDALGGVSTYRKLQRVLWKLRHRAVHILFVSRLKPGSSVCKTPLDQ